MKRTRLENSGLWMRGMVRKRDSVVFWEEEACDMVV